LGSVDALIQVVFDSRSIAPAMRIIIRETLSDPKFNSLLKLSGLQVTGYPVCRIVQFKFEICK
jgi:hypothetical protein